MQLFKLGSTFYPGPRIKNFDRLVWTERYVEPGDFVLEVDDDITILGLLPTGSLISHTATDEVMIVEDHEVFRTKEKKLTVRLRGRSFEQFLEDRLTTITYQPLENSSTGQRIEDIVTGLPEDIIVTLIRSGFQSGYTVVADETVPNLIVRKAVGFPDTARTISVPRGSVYSAVKQLLDVSGYGIKTSRPIGAQTTLDLVVHDGEVLINDVVFYAQQEDLVDARYYWSIKGSKTHAIVDAINHARYVASRNLVANPTGLDRRVMYVEAGDVEGLFASPTSTDIIASRAQAALDGYPPLQIMEATISETARPKFKYDYDVGDLVTVFGEFSVSTHMRVTEHILTFDENGIRGYPSLSSA